MPSIFLTKDELQELTQYTRQAEQRRQLEEMGIPFMPNRLGMPLVHREVLADCFGKGKKRTSSNEPDREALMALQSGEAA